MKLSMSCTGTNSLPPVLTTMSVFVGGGCCLFTFMQWLTLQDPWPRLEMVSEPLTGGCSWHLEGFIRAERVRRSEGMVSLTEVIAFFSSMPDSGQNKGVF